MAIEVRPARRSDVEGIVTWTTNTFEWGDYVPDRITDWMEDPESEVLVSVDRDDVPIAVAHAVMLSPTEGWLEAARVHPDHRRSGLGTALNHAGVAWVKSRGARVVRLATEASNRAARSQVEQLGYRHTTTWVYAWIEVRPDHRVARDLRMRPAPASDVDPAWMFWSTGELSHGGRGFIANGWQWRQAKPGDLAQAAAEGDFFQNPAGWVIADQPALSETRVRWLATSKEEAPRLFEGLIGLAADRESAGLTVKVPKLPWASEAVVRAGGEPSDVLIYAKAVV